MSVVARPPLQEAPVGQRQGGRVDQHRTSRTSQQDPRFCDLSDRCTLDVHHEANSENVYICRICHVRYM